MSNSNFNINLCEKAIAKACFDAKFGGSYNLIAFPVDWFHLSLMFKSDLDFCDLDANTILLKLIQDI